jgi:acetyl-CoA C-acetyltransferase
VSIQARELGIDVRRDLTVTGGMTFAGGPLNNYVLQAVATMAGVLRSDPGSQGLVTAVSGMLTKQGVSLWSTAPPPDGFRWDDVSDEVGAATATLPVVDDIDGAATIDGYTVAYEGGEPVLAVAVVSAAGRRSIATTTDRPLVDAMTTDEWCGRTVKVRPGGTLVD